MKILTSICLLILIINMGLSQQSWEQFRNEKKGYYSTLENSSIENFSCLVSSSDYILFIKNIADSAYYFPLKVIWLKDGSTYTILQPFPPDIKDSVKVQLINQVERLKKVYKGTLSDWQQLSLFTPFYDIPDIATIAFGEDTVGASYSFMEDNQAISLNKTFTRGGQLARVRWIANDLKIVTYPYYRVLEDKWVCRGWESQFYRNDEITSGLAVKLELRRINDAWLPSRFQISAQSQNNRTQKSVMLLYAKDYILNQKIEIISEPSKTAQPPDSGKTSPQR